MKANGENSRWSVLWFELWRLRFSLLFGIGVVIALDLNLLALDPRSFSVLALNALGKSCIGEAVGFSSWCAIHPYWHMKREIDGATTQAKAIVVASMTRNRAMWVGAWILGMNLVP